MSLESSSEKQLWEWLRAGIAKTIEDPRNFVLERIENVVAEGMADVNAVLFGIETWLELKNVDLPKREGTRVLGREGVRTSQVNWHLARSQAGSRTFIVARASPYVWAIPGAYARLVNEWSIDELDQYAAFHISSTKWTHPIWASLILELCFAPLPSLISAGSSPVHFHSARATPTSVSKALGRAK